MYDAVGMRTDSRKNNQIICILICDLNVPNYSSNCTDVSIYIPFSP